jgi:hypothetical protein
MAGLHSTMLASRAAAVQRSVTAWVSAASPL